MICDTCQGKDPRCFRCDGAGELCDCCGEATHERGKNICDACEREREEAEQE